MKPLNKKKKHHSILGTQISEMVAKLLEGTTNESNTNFLAFGQAIRAGKAHAEQVRVVTVPVKHQDVDAELMKQLDPLTARGVIAGSLCREMLLVVAHYDGKPELRDKLIEKAEELTKYQKLMTKEELLAFTQALMTSFVDYMEARKKTELAGQQGAPLPMVLTTDSQETLPEDEAGIIVVPGHHKGYYNTQVRPNA